MTTLTKDNLQVGARITNKSNPEWGVFRVEEHLNGCMYARVCGEAIWDHAAANSLILLCAWDLHFWEIVN